METPPGGQKNTNKKQGLLSPPRLEMRDHHLKDVLLFLLKVRLEDAVAYRCSEAKYDNAIGHPEGCVEVGLSLANVKTKEAAN